MKLLRLLSAYAAAGLLSATTPAQSTDRNTTITRFLTALTCYPELIEIDTYHYFNRLFRQSGVNPPLYYFKLVGCVISKLPLEQYIEFLESTLM